MPVRTSRRSFLQTTLIAGCATALSPLAHLACSPARKFDLIIRNGRIIDGSGSEAFPGDVGISGDLIKAVGNLEGASAPSIIDARNLIVCPGFVDIHSHTDSAVLSNPRAESKLRQGVTLDVGGNCGDSPFPEKKAEVDSVRGASDCTHLAELIGRLDDSKFAINVAYLAGQGTIRSLVLGASAREPDSGELGAMQDILRRSMEQGALGLSSGLEYTPSGYAKSEELIALCRIVAEYDGIYATHMRSEDEMLVEAVEEALHVARESGVSLQISHLKAAGRPNWHKTEEVIERIERARDEGLDVHCDRYPYLAYSTGLGFFYPGWAHEGGSEAFLARLRDRAERLKMKKETLIKVDANGGWETVMIAGVREESSGEYLGRRILEIAEAAGRDPYDFACDLLSREGGRVSIVGYGMSEENTERIISLPYVMIASDGRAVSADGARRGQPHPRSFGTFPRAIRMYVLEKKLLSMQEMIRKMTSLPAEKLRLRGRGKIRDDYFADIVIFDPAEITDSATYVEPWQYGKGFAHILVNGQIVLNNDIQTEVLPGRACIRS